MNVCVDEEKVGRLRLLHETSHGEVSSAMDERLILSSVEHHLDTLGRAETLETQDRLSIRGKTDAPVTRGANK